MTCHQLLYESVATSPLPGEALVELLKKCNEQNYNNGISGILVYHENRFMQLLEGDKSKIESLMQKISHDHRHSNVRILYESDSAARVLGSWAMAFTMEAGNLGYLSEQPFFLSINDAKELCTLMKTEISQRFMSLLAT